MAEAHELLDDEWARLEEGRLRRERGGYNAGNRCWNCRRFVSGPRARCGSCGYEHGGMNHEAYPTR